jgi:hypothetical protein
LSGLMIYRHTVRRHCARCQRPLQAMQGCSCQCHRQGPSSWPRAPGQQPGLAISGWQWRQWWQWWQWWQQERHWGRARVAVELEVQLEVQLEVELVLVVAEAGAIASKPFHELGFRATQLEVQEVQEVQQHLAPPPCQTTASHRASAPFATLVFLFPTEPTKQCPKKGRTKLQKRIKYKKKPKKKPQNAAPATRDQAVWRDAGRRAGVNGPMIALLPQWQHAQWI